MFTFGFRAAARQRAVGRLSPLLTLLTALMVLCSAPDSAASNDASAIRLQGHVLSALADARLAPKSGGASGAPLTLTLVLRRVDEDGFQRYLADVYDPKSVEFRHFSNPQQIADRYGPSVDDYAIVRNFFTGSGFSVVEDSANRLTLTVRASRDAVESALAVRIGEYELDGKDFYANDGDPALPAEVAARVQAIAGLSNLAGAEPLREFHIAIFSTVCLLIAMFDYDYLMAEQGSNAANAAYLRALAKCINWDSEAAGYGKLIGVDPPPPAWQGVDGTGQTIGLLEFDNFTRSDVVDYIQLIGLPASQINKISVVNANGGTPVGANQDEVLLDIADVLSIAPGADIKVYDGPFSGGASFQALFNAMINGGVTIVSNSWAYCEDQTTLADVQSIDAILQSAAASGISVFSGAGDSGSTCLDGSPNTIAVPAGSPNLTAVGGTSLDLGPGYTYENETWWNGSVETPPTGQGGFGSSRFFARPAYQNGLNPSSMRSIPDVSANADPAKGVQICAAALGGCPTGGLYGGTSSSTPMWAAFTALLNQSQGQNLGHLNATIYPLAATDAFHDPASMGSDFTHVGLGSPNLARLHQQLTNQTFGNVNASVSEVHAYSEGSFTFPGDLDLPVYISADGTTQGYVVVRVADSNGNVGGGISVSLAASAGSHAVITPPNGTTDSDTGTIVFRITDTTPEALTFVATSGGVALASIPRITFVSPPAAAAGITAFPTTVPADGVSTTSITVTLHDAQNHPSPGKHITLSQDGRSVVVGPDPPVSDANGQVVFTATDAVEEIVTYTAVDDTDGGLPVPGTAVVTFSGSVAGSCVVPPTAADNYTLTPFANGFVAYAFSYGNVNWGCRGAIDPAFDANGNAYVAHFQTGTLYKFGPDGGSAVAPLATNLGPTLARLIFGNDGRLYATHGATTDFFNGDIVELDPATGAVLRVVATGLTCPTAIAADPLTGDLFVDDGCYGGGSDNPGLFRIANPATNPVVTTYATLPATANGAIAFAPDGTIYVEVGYLAPQPEVVSITGTDQPQPPIITPVPNIWSFFWVNVGSTLPDGSVRSLIILQTSTSGTGSDLNLVDITTNPVQTTTLAHDIGSGTIGPDGCLYTSTPDTVYKIAPDAGACDFTATNPSPTLTLTPRTVAPNPTQGGTQTLTATFRNIDVPAGAAVYVQINGANAQTHLARANANGVATFEYQGAFAGDDVISAVAVVGGVSLNSNIARVTWNTGPHATFLSLPGPVGAVAGQPVTLSASLVDIAVDPQAAIAGAAVHFSVGGRTCDATTTASGVASCSVTLPFAGAYTLTASYAGDGGHLPSSVSAVFIVPIDGIDLIFADGFDGE